jgi:DNA invertase Pin-like site-specific DNA recombinase
MESIQDVMTKAVLYARVSSGAQQKEGTIDSQVVELKRQIAAAGHVLVKEYIDDGITGTVLDRPALEKLRQDAKSDLYDRIYFHAADRITREAAHQTIIIGELLKPRQATHYRRQGLSTEPREQIDPPDAGHLFRV